MSEVGARICLFVKSLIFIKALTEIKHSSLFLEIFRFSDLINKRFYKIFDNFWIFLDSDASEWC